jgi:TPR repeat protein
MAGGARSRAREKARRERQEWLLRVERWTKRGLRGDAKAATNAVVGLLGMRSARSLEDARRCGVVALDHPDPEEAWRAAAEFIWEYGIWWREPPRVGRDPAFGIQLLRNLARRGNAPAMFALSRVHFPLTGVSPDADAAERWARLAARNGEAEAILNLGVRFIEGRGVSRDFKRAVRCYRAAAKSRDKGSATIACANLGLCYRYAQGVRRNLQRSLKFTRRAARAGNSRARVRLAEARIGGAGIRRDVAKGVTELRALARTGNGMAATALGEHLHSLGERNPRLYVRARRWFERGARANDASAMTSAALCLADGHPEFVQRDRRRALALLRRAAKLGDGLAMRELGDRYRKGRDVPRDIARARELYRHARIEGCRLDRRQRRVARGGR